MNPIKYFFLRRHYRKTLREAVIFNIKERSHTSELSYRFFRYKSYLFDKPYNWRFSYSILLKYEPWSGIGFHTRGLMYELTIQKYSWWGYKKRILTTSMLVDHEIHDLHQTIENWKHKIRTKQIV